MHLRAVKGKSKASATANGSRSDKIKEMASFLSVQLLEKVMAETMKPDGDTNMNLEVVERITKALQMSSQPSSETTTSQTAGGDDDEVDDLDLDRVETMTKKKKPNATKKLTVVDDALRFSEDDDTSTTTTTRGKSVEKIDSKPVAAEEETVAVAKEETDVAAAETLKSKIPEVVRKPLEIIQSNIPPLRPESIPKRKLSVVVAEEEKETEATTQPEETKDEEVAAAKTEDVTKKPAESSKEIPSDVVGVVDTAAKTDTSDSLEEIDTTTAMLERQKAEQESFQRRLLKQKLEFDYAQAARIEKEKDSSLNVVETTVANDAEPPASPVEVSSDEGTEEDDDSDSSSSTTSFSNESQSLEETTTTTEAETQVSDATSVLEKETKEEEETPTKGESDLDVDVLVSEPKQVEPESSHPPLTSSTPSPTNAISERRLESIVALRQPKSPDEESKLADKYAGMNSIEARAYAVLLDLGMIEEQQDPRDPSYDHSNDDEYCEQSYLSSS